MSRRLVSRLALVVMLAVPLAFTGPGRAEAAGLANARPTWDWLASLWEDGLSSLWPWSEASTNKQGAGALDPNDGTTQSGTTGTPPVTGPTEGDQGHGIDPNGTP